MRHGTPVGVGLFVDYTPNECVSMRFRANHLVVFKNEPIQFHLSD